MKKNWDDCICGNINGSHELECKRNHSKNRTQRQININKERRHQLRKEHRCIWCGKKVKPVYPQLCEEHNQKNRKANGKHM